MNRNDFNRFIAEGVIPQAGDLTGARELTELFPWFHTAHLVLLKALKESSDIKFDSQLRSSALYVADRERLYQYLFMEQGTVSRPVTDKEVTAREIIAEAEASKEEHLHAADTSQQPVTDQTATRSREELLAEIRSRLEEIEQTTGETLKPEYEDAKTDHAQIPGDTPADLATDESVTDKVEVTDDSLMPEPGGVQPEEVQTPEDVFEIEAATVTETSLITSAGEEIPDDDLLELASPDDFTVVQEAEPLTEADLIDRFIAISPRISRMTSQEQGPAVDLSEESSHEDGSFITETLARIYVNQGYYSKAINIYEKLTLKYPEKSAYFASRIEKIKELIK